MLGFAALAEVALAEIPQTSSASTPVGWFNEWNQQLRHDPKELDRRLKAQKGFGPKAYEAMLAAQATALEAAEKAKNEKRRRALEEAAHAAQELIDKALDEVEARPVPEFDAIIASLNAAASATRAAASIRHAEYAMLAARAALEDYEDEDEVMLLLQ